MPTIYDYMLGAPTADRMQMAADLLRRRRAKATLGVATGDPVLGQLGAGQLQAIEGQAQGLARTRRAARVPQAMGGGQYWSEETGFQAVPGYEAAQERAHGRALGLTRAKARAAEETYLRRFAATQGRIPESTHRKVAGYEAQGDLGNALMGDLAALREGGMEVSEVFKDMPAATLRAAGATGPSTLIEQVTKPKPVRDFKARLASYIDAYRHARYGSQLTGAEIQEFNKSNPLAYGISDADVKSRIEFIRDWYRNQARELASGRAPPGAGAVEGQADLVFNPATGRLEPAQ